MNQIREIIKVLKNKKEILILCHPYPDGDVLGSSMALAKGLRKLGKKVEILSVHPVPRIYSFLSSTHQIKNKINKSNRFSVGILLDSGDENRMLHFYGDWLSQIPIIINIDHHLSNSGFGKYAYVDTKASAVAEQIYEILKMLKVEIDKEMAEDLYVALMTDTGNFRFSNTTAKCLSIASNLIKLGANPSKLHTLIYQNKSLPQVKLITESLCQMKDSCGGKIVWITIPYEIFKKHKIKPEDLESNEILDIIKTKEVQVAMLFKQINKDEVKVSFRSKENVDVNKIAQIFDGGGHKVAAGCILNLSLKDAERRVISEVLKFVR